MISFELLSDNELMELIKSFDDRTLLDPLKVPSKSLQRFIPNGFRIDKLKRYQKAKIFCDAIRAGESGISNYVNKEIETQFERADIASTIASVQSNDMNVYIAICEISIKVWQAHLVLPAHIALLLAEIPCDDESRKVSQALADCYYEDTRRCVQEGYENGKKDAEQKIAVSRAEDQKKIERLQINVDIAKTQRDIAEEAFHTSQAKNAQLIETIDELQHKLDIEFENQNTIEKQKRILHSRIKSLEENNSSLAALNGNLSFQIETHNKDLHDLRVEIEKLTDELVEAEKFAFSEEVIRKLCKEVLDELRASSPSREQVVELAKKRFSSQITIEEAWNQISEDSAGRIHKLCTDFEEKQFLQSQLDELENLEDEILIKYAIIKAFKSVLYYALEAKNMEYTISEEFK